MQLSGLLEVLRQSPAYTDLVTALGDGINIPALGVLRSARPFIVSALAADLKRPILYLTGRVDRGYNVTEQLPVWLPQGRILRFAEPGPLFYEYAPWSKNTIQNRITVLAALCPPPLHKSDGLDASTIIVTSARALIQKTLPVREFKAGSRLLKPGSRIEPQKLLHLLLGLGYEPVSLTTESGVFSHRGGIVDVFPVAMDSPVRIEFFGDEIESLRLFDPASQRSHLALEQVVITPAREALPRLAPPVAGQLAGWFAGRPSSEEDNNSRRGDQEALNTGAGFPALEYYLPYLYSHPASLLDYLPENTLIVIDDQAALHDMIADLETQALELSHEKRSSGELPDDYPLPYLTWDELQEELTARQVLHLGDDSLTTDEAAPRPISALFSPGPRFGGQIKAFQDHLMLLRYQYPAVVVTRQAQRLAELWSSLDTMLFPVEHITTPPTRNDLYFVEGALTEGWVMHSGSHQDDLHLLTDAEIFGWKRPEPRRLQRPRSAAPEASFADLSPGDYVVHVEYGIGRFAGMHKRLLNGTEREYLVVQYAGNDVVYVPIHQADRLGRYIGAGDRVPQLSRLGTPDWAHTKASAQRAVEEMAQELLALYAARAQVSGYAFALDTPWQHEMEAAFPYIETEDQLRAIQEVKRDMENVRPMDRLICGDVGYGKTEVALRAAFKAVMDNKQVAILVPTTVLAQQHYNTFSQRLAPFPLKVEMLSRFRDRRAQQQILFELAEGTIDIVIGTHRLLQSDVQFKDLGLLVIDEEQRFGVTHKERLKQMRTEVDVLTMTATPIPRTLYMALTGIRDISTIQTAPEERLPIITHIGEFDERVVRQAILRELDRGGQIFFVHNRVQTIQAMATRLRGIVPEARITIGHGQMDERTLENVMLRFAEGESDVLVCTTIIESGLDIPNANTIIIDHADWFGLAQLYQLRGRVGRGAMRAYAYLFHPRWMRMNPDAQARLETIKEQNDLGAGFYIAMRDLELRGAGDILGARQSGHIEAVGFHLYTQLLSQAVHRLKHQMPIKPSEDVQTPPLTIDLPLPAFIPTDYIPDMALRLQLYRRLAGVREESLLDEMSVELEDRFGPLPEAVLGLLYQIRIKLRAQNVNVTAIGQDDGQIYLRLPYLAEVDRSALQAYLQNNVRVSRTAVWLPRDLPTEVWQHQLLDLLDRLGEQPEPAARS